jgi:hypothetical protein
MSSNKALVMEEKIANQIHDLVQQLREVTGVFDDDAIVRDALKFHLASLSDKQSLRERMQLIQRKVEALGELDENFDFKKFRNEMLDDD